jgi:hypothetical protein
MDFVLTAVNVENEDWGPLTYSLQQNYPNPFNPSTTINFSTKEFGSVSIKVFDLLGREVAELINEDMPAGHHKVDFNSDKLASGIYYYTLTAGGFQLSKKMILLK